MKKVFGKHVFCMAVMTCVFCALVLKVQYDNEHTEPDRKFIALMDAMYEGKTEYIHIYSTDGKDMTDPVLAAYEEEWKEKDYRAVYESFTDSYIIRYDAENADLN